MVGWYSTGSAAIKLLREYSKDSEHPRFPHGNTDSKANFSSVGFVSCHYHAQTHRNTQMDTTQPPIPPPNTHEYRSALASAS